MGIAEQASGFSVEQDERLITAQRVFIQGDSVAGVDVIPLIGDPLPTVTIGGDTLNAFRCMCRKRVYSIVSSDSRVVQVTCMYSNEPVDESAYGDGDAPPTYIGNLPITMNYTGEFAAFVPPATKEDLDASKWVWADAQSEKILQPVPYAVRTSSLKVRGVVTAERFAEFLPTATAKIGCINSDEVYLIKGIGCWLFAGVDSEAFNDFKDRRMLSIEMTFLFRDPDNTSLNGWQKIMDKSGTWRQPYNLGYSQGIYKAVSFSDLFT